MAPSSSSSPPGPAEFVLERGTEFRPLRQIVDVPRRGTAEVTFRLERWIDLRAGGWHAGNTHIHYDEHERRPDERLRLDPRVEDLSVAVVSILQRRELAYASNRFPVGFAGHLSGAALAVDVGEESRHNRTPWEIGYGHVMLLGLQDVVQPVSRGVLVDDDDPDYPPLVDACDTAHAQGGLAVWCHNGKGMEAPIAAALGRLDAFNLFDPYWMDPEWDVWYDLLDCGFVLPASTGSDWFVCSSNRVYVDIGGGAEPRRRPTATPTATPPAPTPSTPGPSARCPTARPAPPAPASCPPSRIPPGSTACGPGAPSSPTAPRCGSRSPAGPPAPSWTWAPPAICR